MFTRCKYTYIDILVDRASLCRDILTVFVINDSLLTTLNVKTIIDFCFFSFPTEIQLKRQERKRRSTCISPQNALDIDPEVI